MPSLFLEDLDSDIHMRSLCAKAYNKLAAYFHSGNRFEFDFEFADGQGEYFGISMERVGVQMPGLLVLIGKKNPKAIGISGRYVHFKGPIVDDNDRAIFVDVLKAHDEAKAASVIGTPAFHDVFCHEFMHALDDERTKGRMFAIRTDDFGLDSRTYYNDAAEFNAYYHDLVDHLSYLLIMLRNGEQVDDSIAEFLGYTGNFAQDLAYMAKKNTHTHHFMKWLTDDRRRALLKRVYRIYQGIGEAMRASKTKVSGSKPD